MNRPYPQDRGPTGYGLPSVKGDASVVDLRGVLAAMYMAVGMRPYLTGKTAVERSHKIMLPRIGEFLADYLLAMAMGEARYVYYMRWKHCADLFPDLPSVSVYEARRWYRADPEGLLTVKKFIEACPSTFKSDADGRRMASRGIWEAYSTWEEAAIFLKRIFIQIPWKSPSYGGLRWGGIVLAADVLHKAVVEQNPRLLSHIDMAVHVTHCNANLLASGKVPWAFTENLLTLLEFKAQALPCCWVNLAHVTCSNPPEDVLTATVRATVAGGRLLEVARKQLSRVDTSGHPDRRCIPGSGWTTPSKHSAGYVQSSLDREVVQLSEELPRPCHYCMGQQDTGTGKCPMHCEQCGFCVGRHGESTKWCLVCGACGNSCQGLCTVSGLGHDMMCGSKRTKEVNDWLNRMYCERVGTKKKEVA